MMPMKCVRSFPTFFFGLIRYIVMLKKLIGIYFLCCAHLCFSGQEVEPLTVEKIMRDPKWMGTSPSNPYWSQDGKFLLFSWNPETAVSDSIYYTTTSDLHPVKASYSFTNKLTRATSVTYNTNRSQFVFANAGDIYLQDVKTGSKRRITQTNEVESNPQFAFND